MNEVCVFFIIARSVFVSFVKCIHDLADICDTPPEYYDPNPVKKHPINTHSSVVLKGKMFHFLELNTIHSSQIRLVSFHYQVENRTCNCLLDWPHLLSIRLPSSNHAVFMETSLSRT